jgi:hypothetical protein
MIVILPLSKPLGLHRSVENVHPHTTKHSVDNVK